MNLARLIILPFKGLFLLLRWILAQGLRGIIMAAVIVGIGWGILHYVDPFDMKEPAVADIPEARYYVTTSSRNYYTDSYTENGDMIILHGYWEFTGEGRRAKWVYREATLPLTPAFGDCRVQARKE